MKKKFKIVGLGGTFDELHKGHRALLTEAFELGDLVLIGLCTDEFARKLHKNHKIASYEDRRKELRSFLEKMGFLERADIIPLDDPYGISVTDGKMQAIVLSKETEQAASIINAMRERNGLPPLKVIVMDMVQAKDHAPISTTRIRRDEIDRDGHLLNPSRESVSQV